MRSSAAILFWRVCFSEETQDVVSEALDPSTPILLSDELLKFLNSHLLFVYDETQCRTIEGFEQHSHSVQTHRDVALAELSRRLKDQTRGQSYGPKRVNSEENTLPEIETIYLDTLDMEIAKVPEGLSIHELETISQGLPCVKFTARDDVKYVEDNNLRAKTGLISDPLFRYQWALKGPVSGAGFGIDMESVWQNYSPKAKTLIAIIDSGCTQSHPDMTNRYWHNPGEKSCNDGIDDDNNGFIDDCHGWDFVRNNNNPTAEGQTSHGTAAAGIIAANMNNKQGIAGICPDCELLCLRFISNTEGTVVNEVRAIDYAIKMGARISNNSYGGYARHGSKVEKEAIARAHKKGHLFISSAGNNNLATDFSDYIHTPSGYGLANIISVGASTENGRKTPFSNYGKETVHVFAPGRNIISTGKDGYVVNQGTSFAAPHVAGLAGLIWSTYPDLANTDVKDAIIQSCRKIPDLESASACGGVVDAPKAMEIAREKDRLRQMQGTPSPALPEQPQVNPSIKSNSNLLVVLSPGGVEVSNTSNSEVDSGNNYSSPSYTINASSLYQVLPTAKRLINAPATAFREVAKKAENTAERWNDTVRRATLEGILPFFHN